MRKWFVLSLILFLFLVGCTNNKEGADEIIQNNDPENELIDPIEYEDNKATLYVYGHMYNGNWEKDYKPFLDEKFPNYEFVFISAYDETAGLTVEELIATGTKIDLYQGAAGALQERFIPVNLETSMNELMEYHGIDVNDFIPQFLKAGMAGDDHLMLPISNNNFVMFYNNAIFERFGVEPPWDGMTWDEAIDKANDITRYEGKQYIGLWYSPNHFLRANQKSLGFVDPDTNEPLLGSDEWKEWVTKLFYEPMRDPGLQERAQTKFFGHDDFRHEEVVAMYVYSAGWMNDNPYVDWKAVSIPTFDGDGIGTQPIANYWGLASTSQHPNEAMRVIKYLVGEEFQSHWSRKGRMSSLKSEAVQNLLYEEVEGIEDKNLHNAIFTNTYAEQREITAYDELLIEGPLGKEILPSIVRGQIEVNEGMRTAVDRARQEIDLEILRQKTSE